MKHSTQRIMSLLAGLALLFASLVVFLNLVRPEYLAAQEQKGENISKKNLLENQKQTAEQVQQIVAEYKGNSTLEKVVSMALPPGKNEAEAVYHINQLAAKHRLAPQSVTVQNPGARATAKTPRGAKAAATLLKPVGVLNIQTRLAGTYADFRGFLSDLETNLRLMDVASVTLAPVGKTNQDFYNFDITVGAYYQTQ